jgi:GNAT superfamily N-acetyltransferase
LTQSTTGDSVAATERRFSIIRLKELEGRRCAPLIAGLEPVFFLNTATQEFASEGERMLFYDRWLGRYLRYYPGWFYFALDAEGGVAGYLAGCTDSAAAQEHFKDIEYYHRFWRSFADFPAHLHVNVRGDLHGQGIGSALVKRFADDLRAAAAGGLHAITGAASPAVGFYERCGMRRAMVLEWQGRRLVMMGMRLQR